MMKYFENSEQLCAYLKQQLTDTDWSVLPDVDIANKEEFISYRAIIRDLYLKAELGCAIPETPKAIWNTQISQ